MLDTDQARCFVGPGLCPNCLKKLQMTLVGKKVIKLDLYCYESAKFCKCKIMIVLSFIIFFHFSFSLSSADFF